MAEYIEREAISEEIRKYYYKNPPNSSYGEGFDRGLDRAQRAILDAPAADVEPVVHGRWMHEETEGGFPTWKCSRCGHGTNYDPNGIDLYCYHCGAKMNGGSDNA